MLNRVFKPEVPIEVELLESPQLFATHTDSPAELKNQAPTRRNLLVAGASITSIVLVGTTLATLSIWNQSQQAIRQERNMLLIERLRTMGPGTNPPKAAAASSAVEDGGLPPPPPGEPWMEELATLPVQSAPQANVLKVQPNSNLARPAPPATGSASSPRGNVPQLVGVVQVQGQKGSAIFQLGGSSTNTAAGENIGNSGWRLISVSSDAAVIQKGGEQNRININSEF